MKIDNFYFVVKNVGLSIKFYTELLEKEPTTITEDRWADWENENNQIYFGIISEKAAGAKRVLGNNGVLGLYTKDIDASFNKCQQMGVKILYNPESVPNSIDHYRCFAIEDLDGNKIEIATYDI